MTSLPFNSDNEQIGCVKMTAEEAAKIAKQTTENELAKLAEIMKNQKLPARNDVLDEVEFDSDVSDTEDSSDDEDFVPSKRKRNSSSNSIQLHQNVESKMYVDNQNLWKKIHKYGIELNRVQKELHYLQLELNNKTIEYNKQKEQCKTIETFTNENKKLQTKLIYFKVFNYYCIFLITTFAIDYSTRHMFFENIFHLCYLWTKLIYQMCIFLQNQLT